MRRIPSVGLVVDAEVDALGVSGAAGQGGVGGQCAGGLGGRVEAVSTSSAGRCSCSGVEAEFPPWGLSAHS